jgi:hypothetical protein
MPVLAWHPGLLRDRDPNASLRTSRLEPRMGAGRGLGSLGSPFQPDRAEKYAWR